MPGEVIAFADMFDTIFAIHDDLSRLLGKSIPIQLLTDSKCLFDVISKGSRTSEKRNMIDIDAARQSFKSGIISDIGFVRSKQNIADRLSKSMGQTQILNLLTSGNLQYECEQWIIRDAHN